MIIEDFKIETGLMITVLEQMLKELRRGKEWLCDQWKPEMVAEYTDCELADLLNKHKIIPPKEYGGSGL